MVGSLSPKGLWKERQLNRRKNPSAPLHTLIQRLYSLDADPATSEGLLVSGRLQKSCTLWLRGWERLSKRRMAIPLMSTSSVNAFLSHLVYSFRIVTLAPITGSRRSPRSGREKLPQSDIMSSINRMMEARRQVLGIGRTRPRAEWRAGSRRDPQEEVSRDVRLLHCAVRGGSFEAIRYSSAFRRYSPHLEGDGETDFEVQFGDLTAVRSKSPIRVVYEGDEVRGTRL